MSLLGKALGFAVREGEDVAAREGKNLAVRAASPEAQARRLAIKRAATEVQPLPAPARPLALPKPAPKPKGKPKGGQWFPDKELGAPDAKLAGFSVRDQGQHVDPYTRHQVVMPSGAGSNLFAHDTPTAWQVAEGQHQRALGETNLSPESVARKTRAEHDLYGSSLGDEHLADPMQQLGDWFEKAYAKYLRNDFGTEADPLGQLAARGLHFDPEMTPERWQYGANSLIQEDPIGHFVVPRHESDVIGDNQIGIGNALADFAGSYDPQMQGALSQAAPWLRKQPATDMLYGMREGPDIGHFVDELVNATDPQASGIPSDLAVRPENLGRMSFPQAVERVGRINQWRAAEMEKARQGFIDHPAIQLHKEYPDAPGGLRWVELKAPDPGEHLLDATDRALAAMGSSPDALNERYAQLQREKLQEVLKQEGDVMGHCVGGYCPDVMSGASRIFSLRDAKGMPHVTIETSPAAQTYRNVVNAVGDRQAAEWLDQGIHLRDMVDMAGIQRPQDIVQIKGKQNRAPNPEYLPFVQDFVKSGQWGHVGDLRNTGLVPLPDKRYITVQNAEKGIADIPGEGVYDPSALHRMAPEDWEAIKQHFEGFKRGGFVVKRGCGCAKCNGGLAVRG